MSDEYLTDESFEEESEEESDEETGVTEAYVAPRAHYGSGLYRHILAHAENVDAFSTWLKLNYARDVLIPCVKGEKRPSFTHSGGAWSWARFEYESLRTKSKDADLGLLLFDLCVVDCDTKEVAAAMEKRYPELRSAPCALTARGMHYFFSRSRKADLHGFYDSVGAVEESVDFKTRCFSGGRGLVLVAPSTGKEWLRAPWKDYESGGIPAISDDLLSAVAKPSHIPITVRFSAKDTPPQTFTSGLFASASYFRDMLNVGRLSALSLSETGADTPPPEIVLPEGYSASDLTDLLRCAEGRCPLSSPTDSAEAHEEYMRRLLSLGDFVGAPDSAMAALRAAGPGGGRNWGDLIRIDPIWAAEVMAAEQRTESILAVDTPNSPLRALTVVDSALAEATRYVPLLPQAPHDHRFLLHSQPRVEVAAGALTLAAAPVAAAKEALPHFIRNLLRKEAGHLALAGGAALAAVSAPGGAQPSDYDLFAYGFNGTAEEISAASDALLRRILSSSGIDDGRSGVSVTRCAVTFRAFDEDEGREFIVQIVLRTAADPADIVTNFDLPPAKVLLTAVKQPDGKTKLVCLAAADWVVAMRHLAFPVDGAAHFTRSGPLRILKYQAKGYDVLVPRLTSRALIRREPTSRVWQGREALQRQDGWQLLLSLELAVTREVEARRLGPWWNRNTVPTGPARTQPVDVARISRRVRAEQRAEYLESLRMKGVLSYIWDRALMFGRRAKRAVGIGSQSINKPFGWRQPFSPPLTRPVNICVTDVLAPDDPAP